MRAQRPRGIRGRYGSGEALGCREACARCPWRSWRAVRAAPGGSGTNRPPAARRRGALPAGPHAVRLVRREDRHPAGPGGRDEP
ncbi:hypothetical protein Srut_50490 [Streptomyces rutgersensis]|nr:hypothetical protein Srut_50490 [Streptomyces rutgersensis]